MRRALLVLCVGFALAPAAATAGLDAGLHLYDPKGRVRAVRAADWNGDGRRDLVLLVDPPRGDGPPRTEVLLLPTPAAPEKGTFFRPAEEVRIPCDGPGAGALARCGALAVGRFGPEGSTRLRFLGPEGVLEVDPTAPAAPPSRVAGPTLLARSAGGALVFWDAVGDLDGDGRDEAWWPDADGRVRLAGLALPVEDEAQRSPTELFFRKVHVPSVAPADVDGDGRLEVVRLEGTTLVVERPGAAGGSPAAARVALPFLAPDPSRPPEELRTPRIAVTDVDGDGKADLLVTVVQGRADKLGGLRTALYHVPGPFVDPATGALREPKGRIDTESVALHPAFVDVTGDGAKDYVADSIRGNMFDLVRRVMGAEPEITFTIFRFDRGTGTYERSPYATFVRPYSAAQARGNTFGPSGFFSGDFDGDGRRDLLDLGNLGGIAIWRGGAGEGAFSEPLLGRVPIDGGRTLAPDAVVDDLNGDGRADAVTWAEDRLYLVVSRPPR